MFSTFDTSKLFIRPLSERKHNLDLSIIAPLKRTTKIMPKMVSVANRIVSAKKRGSAVVLMIGAHVLRSGVQRYIIDLMERGYISCVATNGACIVHDYEFARIGQTTESVAAYIQDGQFGLWREVGEINDIVSKARDNNSGLGEAIGKAIIGDNFPHKDISIFAAGFRLKIPVTTHVGIGYDITHEHPNCDGAAWGQTSYLDFLRFVKCLELLDGGVIMNFGSAVMAPEVYLKALSMVRNVANREGRKINDFVSLVCDIRPLPEQYEQEAATDNADYFFRPWKTMLVRTVADGGRGYYVNGRHADTIPALWTAICDLKGF